MPQSQLLHFRGLLIWSLDSRLNSVIDVRKAGPAEFGGIEGIVGSYNVEILSRCRIQDLIL